jgi:hypothetical protein
MEHFPDEVSSVSSPGSMVSFKVVEGIETLELPPPHPPPP